MLWPFPDGVLPRQRKKPPEEGRSGKITIDNYSLLEYNLIKEEEQKQRGEVP